MKRLHFALSLATFLTLGQTASFAAGHAAIAPLYGNDPVILAQSVDQSFRVNELESEVRRLNGKVEELNFLLLELQEKFRKLEEDNEERFQELEEKSETGTGSDDVARTDDGSTERLEKPEPSAVETQPDAELELKTAEDKPAAKPRDLAPRALGTLTFDENGNVIDARPQGDRLAGLPESDDGDLEASEFGATPSEVFAAAAQASKSRDYETARKALTAHRNAWPTAPNAGEVLFALGEAQFWLKNYLESANTHLEAHKTFPEAPTAADNLLGLGLALAGLNQREVACATYAEVLKQYPGSAERLGERVKDEQAAAKC